MNKKLTIDLQKILLYALLTINVTLCISLTISFFPSADFLLSLFNPIFSYTSWQVFTTLSTLTVALLSIIIVRIDERYYGLAVKDVLYLTASKSELRLNYWEMVLVIICFSAVAGLFLVFEQFLGAFLVELWGFGLLLQIVVSSIGVLTHSENFKEKALNYTNRILLMVTKEYMEEAKTHILRLGREAEERIEIDIDPKKNAPLTYLPSTSPNYFGPRKRATLEKLRFYLMRPLKSAHRPF